MLLCLSSCRCMYGSCSGSLWSPTHPPFRHRHRRCPVRDCFIRYGSAGASGEPWTTATTAPPRRASQTSTASRGLLRAHHPCLSPSLLSSSSSQNALPNVPPRFRDGVVVIFRRDAAAVVALLILPPNEQRADVDHRHRHRRDRRTPHCRCSGARRRCDDRAEEDPVRQEEEGVIQAVPGVSAVASVALLLLRCRRRRR
jgi:hypothetical protein